MLLVILLLASSGIVLASPRLKGSPLVQASIPNSYGQFYNSAPEQRQGADARYQPTVENVLGSGDDDPNTTVLRISPKDLQYFKIRNTANQPEIPDPQLTAPSSPTKNDKSNQGNTFDSHLSTQSDYQESETRDSPRVGQFSAALQDGDAVKRRTEQDLLGLAGMEEFMRAYSRNDGDVIMARSDDSAFDLIDNYTLILNQPLESNFSCQGRSFGYYADVKNRCQIYHICVPLRQFWPIAHVPDITRRFSFICPGGTVFDQMSLVCTYEETAVECDDSPDLYWMNLNMYRFITYINDDGENITRRAHMNDHLD